MSATPAVPHAIPILLELPDDDETDEELEARWVQDENGWFCLFLGRSGTDGRLGALPPFDGFNWYQQSTNNTSGMNSKTKSLLFDGSIAQEHY